MRSFLFQLSKLILSLPFLYFLNCADDEFCHPLDPAPGDCPQRWIDNFDDGRDPNLLGYNPQFFFHVPESANVITRYESKAENVRNGVGYSMRIEFDVSRESNLYGGWIQPIGQIPDGGLKAAKFNYLTFWIKAASEDNSINFEIALKDLKTDPISGEFKHETDPKKLLRNFDNFIPTTTWKQVRIPLSQLLATKNLVDPIDLNRLYQLIFGFGKKTFQENGGDFKGAFYIDEIALEK